MQVINLKMILSSFPGSRNSRSFYFIPLKKLRQNIKTKIWLLLDFTGGSDIKTLPAIWETWVPSLGWEDPLEEGMETYYSILAWGIPMDREAWQATVHGVSKT